MKQKHTNDKRHVQKGSISEFSVMFYVSSKLRCCWELVRLTIRSPETFEQAFSSPSDAPVACWSVTEIGGPRDISRPVPSRPGTRKSRSKAGRDGTIITPAGRRTGRDSFSECGTGHAINTFLRIPRWQVIVIPYDNENYRVELRIVWMI